MLQVPEVSQQQPAANNVRDLMLSLVSSLVDDKQAVTLDARSDSLGTAFLLHVSQTDIAKVIGTNGKTLRSLRIILRAAGLKYDHPYTLELSGEPLDPGRLSFPSSRRNNDTWH